MVEQRKIFQRKFYEIWETPVHSKLFHYSKMHIWIWQYSELNIPNHDLEHDQCAWMSSRWSLVHIDSPESFTDQLMLQVLRAPSRQHLCVSFCMVLIAAEILCAGRRDSSVCQRRGVGHMVVAHISNHIAARQDRTRDLICTKWIALATALPDRLVDFVLPKNISLGG